MTTFKRAWKMFIYSGANRPRMGNYWFPSRRHQAGLLPFSCFLDKECPRMGIIFHHHIAQIRSRKCLPSTSTTADPIRMVGRGKYERNFNVNVRICEFKFLCDSMLVKMSVDNVSVWVVFQNSYPNVTNSKYLFDFQLEKKYTRYKYVWWNSLELITIVFACEYASKVACLLSLGCQLLRHTQTRMPPQPRWVSH